MTNIDLTGRIALVTGSSSGIGLEIARTLAAAGAKVAVNYLQDREGAEQAVADIRAAGGEAASFQADAAQPGQLEAMVAAIGQTFGRSVDILVNNAGHLVRRVPNGDMTEEHYGKVMDVNFKSCVFACKAVLPGMIASGGGRIVNITSVAAHDGGGPGATIYAAGKSAMIAYTKGLAKEAGPHGINVNAVSPGFIGQTRFHATFTPDAARAATIGKIPLGREGTPIDVAHAVLFFVSPLAAYITGETLEVNGGLLMR